MAIATTDANGLPDVRMVLLRRCAWLAFTPIPNAQGSNCGEHGVASCIETLRQVRFRVRWNSHRAEADTYSPRRAQPHRRVGPAIRPLESRFALESCRGAIVSTSERCPGSIDYCRIRPLYIEF
jgi:pyridoxamine 5'-phosphate oxidase